MSHEDVQGPTAAELLASEEADRLPTGLDLREVMDALQAQLRGCAPDSLRGFVTGKTVMRDGITAALGCSMAQSELLVDTLEARGWLRFDADDMPAGLWHLQ